ncbi:MAG: GNAT family N-acetyltransferase [Eubacteriales bacterium]|jgi:RimJ/RimL family protein N-acetyltransferase
MKTNLKYYYTNFPVIEYDNILLREITEADLNDLAECITDVEIYKYWGDNRSTLEKNVISYYKRFLQRTPNEKRNCFHWGIILKDENKLIGQIFINKIENNRMSHIGYRISRKYWNNGYVTKAIKAVVDFCFKKTELKRLYTSVDIRNIASWKALEKCGFTREGFIRQGKFGRKYCDYYLYGLIKSDYKNNTSGVSVKD